MVSCVQGQAYPSLLQIGNIARRFDFTLLWPNLEKMTPGFGLHLT